MARVEEIDNGGLERILPTSIRSKSPEEIVKLSAQNKLDNENIEFENKIAAMGHDNPYFALKGEYKKLEKDFKNVKNQKNEYKKDLARFMVDYIIHNCENDDRHLAEILIKNLL